EKHYQRLLKEPRGATFAVAAVSLSEALTSREQMGENVDANQVVRLAEEAHAAAPSRATQSALVTAILFHAHQQLVKQEPDYAKMASRARRSLSPSYLIAVAISEGGKLRDAVLANKDVRRACEMLKESTATFPDEIS